MVSRGWTLSFPLASPSLVLSFGWTVKSWISHNHTPIPFARHRAMCLCSDQSVSSEELVTAKSWATGVFSQGARDYFQASKQKSTHTAQQRWSLSLCHFQSSVVCLSPVQLQHTNTLTITLLLHWQLQKWQGWEVRLDWRWSHLSQQPVTLQWYFNNKAIHSYSTQHSSSSYGTTLWIKHQIIDSYSTQYSL